MNKRKKALVDQLLTATSPPSPFNPSMPTPMSAMEQLFGKFTRQSLSTLFQNYRDGGSIPKIFEVGPEPPVRVPDELDSTEQDTLQSLQQAINHNQKDEQAYEQALELKTKYPDTPMIAELILGYLMTFGERDLLIQQAQSMLQKFPFNLYARNLLVLNALSERNLAEVEAVLANKFEIYEHSAPEKTRFETPEVLNFYGALGNYYVLKGNIPRAIWCYVVCHDVDPMGEVVEMLSQTILTYLQDDNHQKALKAFLEQKTPSKLKKLGKR